MARPPFTKIGIEELPQAFQANTHSSGEIMAGIHFSGNQWLEKTLPEVQKEVSAQVERRYLKMVLKKTRGRIDRTAEIAGIHPRGLYNKMKVLGLNKEDFK